MKFLLLLNMADMNCLLCRRLWSEQCSGLELYQKKWSGSSSVTVHVCVSARGSGGMLPQKIFCIFSVLRLILVQSEGVKQLITITNK